MSFATVFSRSLNGIQSPLISIETHISNGLPSLSIVGLPETTVKESKDRVRSAILNSHFEFPTRRITINLAPADVPKQGSRFDLAIAISILAASGQIPNQELDTYEFVGELSLSGELRSCLGTLPLAIATQSAKRKLILPQDNAQEACLIEGVNIYPASSLLQVCNHLAQKQPILNQQGIPPLHSPSFQHDISDVKGQAQAKRALEIAAAGRHNLLMFGSPGIGKTMLANRLLTILPQLNKTEALAAASIQSLRTPILAEQWQQPSFRAPHHSASAPAIIGGGNPPQPGEISLSHQGILFLDELPEFNRVVLEALREPLQSHHVTISRAKHSMTFPADFQLIAAMNPCPCGYHQSKSKDCYCSSIAIQRYRQKLSGPLLDRIDLHVRLTDLGPELLQQKTSIDNSETVRERVIKARRCQLKRNESLLNARLTPKQIEHNCQCSAQSKLLLNTAMDKLKLSARAYHRTLSVARTIADLADSDMIEANHISEALSFRQLI